MSRYTTNERAWIEKECGEAFALLQEDPQGWEKVLPTALTSIHSDCPLSETWQPRVADVPGLRNWVFRMVIASRRAYLNEFDWSLDRRLHAYDIWTVARSVYRKLNEEDLT